MAKNTLAKAPKINIEFENLSYTIKGVEQRDKKILNNIHGYFKSGNISAILGPSGAGKSTLLNVLAGYTTTNITGTIRVNGKPRDLDNFYKSSRYIMQENLLLERLSVAEMMLFAAHFKLGNIISEREKLEMIDESLERLRLSDTKKTWTNKLSGGEKKRLIIAMELIGNPSVIFLDEPTSGLDEQSGYYCIKLLRNLAEEGRTIITAIHSPSANLFEKIQHTYVITNGLCVYQGEGTEIISFLNKINLECPIYHTPIDFLLDVSNGEYGDNLNKLVELTDNGRLTYDKNQTRKIADMELDNGDNLKFVQEYYSSYWSQLYRLYHRIMLQGLRNKMGIINKSILMILTITTLTTLFYKVGNNGKTIKSDVSFIFLSLTTFLYITMMPTLIVFPMEFRIVRSEYFNKWYSLPSYFTVVCLQTLPFLVTYAFFYLLIAYPLTSQPIEFDRMFYFFTFCLLIALVSEALAQCLGSLINNMINAMFVGCAILSPLTMFAIQSFGHDVALLPQFYQYLIKSSYLRYAFEGMATAIYQNRGEIPCPEEELFCPLSTYDQVIIVFGFRNADMFTSLTVLICYYVVFKVFAYCAMKERLKPSKFTHILSEIKNCTQTTYNKYFVRN